MPRYCVFGGCLRSKIALPELRRTRDGASRWTLRTSRRRPALGGAELLGTDEVMDTVQVRLYKLAAGYRLDYDDTGCFDISADGRDIVWSPAPNAYLEAVRLDVIARVLPLALHASGLLCLHGSGVALDGGAIGFLAPRFYGKSTLAMAMATAGGRARILADDALAVEPHPPVTAWPGVHSVRLWDDAAERIIGNDGGLNSVGAYPLPRRDGTPWSTEPSDRATVTHKQILSRLPEDKLMFEPTRLEAIYLVTPLAPGPNTLAARRTMLPAVRAAVSLVQHAKLGPLLGKSEAVVLLDRAVNVAQRVPVYELAVARDLDRIPEVVAQLTAWHRGEPTASPAQGHAQ